MKTSRPTIKFKPVFYQSILIIIIIGWNEVLNKPFRSWHFRNKRNFNYLSGLNSSPLQIPWTADGVEILQKKSDLFNGALNFNGEAKEIEPQKPTGIFSPFSLVIHSKWKTAICKKENKFREKQNSLIFILMVFVRKIGCFFKYRVSVSWAKLRFCFLVNLLVNEKKLNGKEIFFPQRGLWKE